MAAHCASYRIDIIEQLALSVNSPQLISVAFITMISRLNQS